MAIVEKVDGFFIPNVTLIGVGAAKAIPERIVYLNATKPLLVTDKGIVHTGILKQITDILDEAAMEYAIYDETVPNPTDLNVAAGVELYKKKNATASSPSAAVLPMTAVRASASSFPTAARSTITKAWTSPPKPCPPTSP